jgi:hypothetical protein
MSLIPDGNPIPTKPHPDQRLGYGDPSYDEHAGVPDSGHQIQRITGQDLIPRRVKFAVPHCLARRRRTVRIADVAGT